MVIKLNQNAILINNAITKNYYDIFKQSSDIKDLCLTFYYNHRFGDIFSLADSNKIIEHLNILLDYYIKQKFKCNIKINDDLWITDQYYRDKIVDVFINKFRNSEYKPQEITIICNVIHCLDQKNLWFIDLIKRFNEINIDVKLNFETMLIDIVDVEHLIKIKDFLLSYVNKLKIKINPNNFVYFTEIFETLYFHFKPILFMFEEDSFNWTDYKINEYIEFLDLYIDKIYNETNNDNIQFLKELFLNDKLNLISLQNIKNSCSFYKSLNIILEDLSIFPCPKMQYDSQRAGKYQYMNNEIVDIDIKSLKSFALNTILNKYNDSCNSCPLFILCEGFCCKESYRRYSNANTPLQENCILKKIKYAFLFFKLKQFNVMSIENFEQIPELDFSYAKQILNLYNSIVGGINDEGTNG